VIVHITELTQPQGHSTSGSHERYKDEARLSWEREHDCLTKMRGWILEQGVAREAELRRMEQEDLTHARQVMAEAWEAYIGPIRRERDSLVALLGQVTAAASAADELARVTSELGRLPQPQRRDLMRGVHDALVALRHGPPAARATLSAWRRAQAAANEARYSSHLHSESASSALAVPVVEPVFDEGVEELRGFEILNRCFDAALARDPRVIALGEDVGKLGDVNQGFAGLQEKYGALRVSDTGIRECTILGQGIGMAMRGLRPIVEIQYLDYLLYALQIMSDDLATLQYRTRGGQKAPLIVRTRGHRLEGIWHAGSPMAGILNLLRGVWLCVPRDMTRAAGFYNTLLRSDDPGLVIEVLNGYRLRERLPRNIGELTVPLGIPEVLRAGSDVTVVTYGACCRIVLEATSQLAGCGIETEVIDVQTLLPFDVEGRIVDSLKKTARLVLVDEDVPGGGTAYMMQQVLDRSDGYGWLDSAPRAVSAKPHRPAYGSDGDYFSKPNREDVVRAVYELMREADPRRFPSLD
jgi:pyruvate/2-oxoglutarate/acetoin dehydrogenase E1 component